MQIPRRSLPGFLIIHLLYYEVAIVQIILCRNTGEVVKNYAAYKLKTEQPKYLHTAYLHSQPFLSSRSTTTLLIPAGSIYSQCLECSVK